MICALFSYDPDELTTGAASPLARASQEALLLTLSFLDVADITRSGACCRKLLVTSHSPTLWAELCLHRRPAPDSLEACSARLGPVRTLDQNGNWAWRGSREAYIRALEMRRGGQQVHQLVPQSRLYHAVAKMREVVKIKV